jgi:hypothetical protein
VQRADDRLVAVDHVVDQVARLLPARARARRSRWPCPAPAPGRRRRKSPCPRRAARRSARSRPRPRRARFPSARGGPRGPPSAACRWRPSSGCPARSSGPRTGDAQGLVAGVVHGRLRSLGGWQAYSTSPST